MGKITFSKDANDFRLELVDWPEIEEEVKHVIRDTKPYTLRNVHAKSVTINDRLYIIHNLCGKDPDRSTLSFKYPVRIMDFKSR